MLFMPSYVVKSRSCLGPTPEPELTETPSEADVPCGACIKWFVVLQDLTPAAFD
jgi:hypothetical protein